MEQEQKQQFKCTGDCLNCHRVQREYCASQKAYDNQRLLLEMQESIKSLSGSVEELKIKVSAIQDNEAMVFDPNKDIAQSGDGAEIDAPI